MELLDFGELAAKSGVSARTIRFYQQHGLLAAPGKRGPGARYGRADLDRLRLIRLLQKEHLPLSEIRKRLEAMTDDDVARALEPGSAPVAGDGSSAAVYARGVLAYSPQPLRAPTMVREPGLIARMAPDAVAEPSAPPRLMRESWERVAVAPDVELHIRRPLSRTQNRLVEHLLAAVQHFMEHEEPR